MAPTILLVSLLCLPIPSAVDLVGRLIEGSVEARSREDLGRLAGLTGNLGLHGAGQGSL